MTGRPADPRPGLAADLATLRDVHDRFGMDEYVAAMGRVEAELERLREERDAAINGRDDLPMAHVILAQLEAAEARCARLQQALQWMADYKMTGSERTLHIDFQGKAREALAGPDTPADSQEDKTMSAQRWERIAAERGTRMDELQARAEAAEAEVARLTNKLNEDSQNFEIECLKAERDRLDENIRGARERISLATRILNAALDDKDHPR